MKFEPVVQEEMSFKGISYLELWQPLLFSGLDPFVQLWKKAYEESADKWSGQEKVIDGHITLCFHQIN